MTAPEVIVFPDATKLLIDYLNAELGIPVHHEIPKPRPTAFLTVRRVGGVRQTLVSDNPMVVFEAWSNSHEDAHSIAQAARALVHAARGQVLDGVAVYGIVEISGPADLPDPLSNQPRFTFTLTVAVRGSVSAS